LALNESEQAVARLMTQLETAKTELLNGSHGDRLTELETLVQNLRDQLADQERDASDVVLQWQDSYNEIELRLNAATSENEILLMQLQESKDALENAQAQLTKAMSTVCILKVGQLLKENRNNRAHRSGWWDPWNERLLLFALDESLAHRSCSRCTGLKVGVGAMGSVSVGAVGFELLMSELSALMPRYY
jgi:hypothetical protein